MAIDFPSLPLPIGTTYIEPTTGVIYTWTGTAWDANSAGTGGTVTRIDTTDGVEGGPIITNGTLSVDNTVVRTTGTQYIDGQKGFLDAVLIGSNLPTTTAITLGEDGTAVFTNRAQNTQLTTAGDPDQTLTTKSYVDSSVSGVGDHWEINGNNLYPTSDSYNVRIAGAGGNPTIVLEPSGTGTFDGYIQSGGDPTNATADGTRLTETGIVLASRTSGTSALFAGYLTGNSTPTSRINAEGSAEFAGGNIVFANSGDATFEGDVSIGDGFQGQAGTGIVASAAGGKINLYSDSGTGGLGNYFLAGYSGNAPKTRVFSIDYAGNITSNEATFDGAVSAEDTLDVTNSTTNTNSFVQRWFSDIGGADTQKAIMMATGQLTLSGDGNQGAYVSAPATASGGYKAYYAKSASAGVNTQYFLYGDDAGDVNTVRIATDGSADFYGEVTAQGRTLAETQTGTWTPTCNAGTLTPVASRCYWVRNGNLVTLNGSINNFTDVSDGAEILLSGYPYEATEESYGNAFFSRAAAGTGSNVPINACYVLAERDGGGIKFIGGALTRGDGAWGLRYNNLSSTQEGYFQVTYMTADTTWVPSV